MGVVRVAVQVHHRLLEGGTGLEGGALVLGEHVAGAVHGAHVLLEEVPGARDGGGGGGGGGEEEEVVVGEGGCPGVPSASPPPNPPIPPPVPPIPPMLTLRPPPPPPTPSPGWR